MRGLLLGWVVVLICSVVMAYPTSTNLAPSAGMLGDGERLYEISFTSYGGLFCSGTERYAFSQFSWRNLEWGLDLYHIPDDNGDYQKRWALNLKAQVWKEKGNRPSLVVGILDVGKGLTAAPYAVFGKTKGRSAWHLGSGRLGQNERWWVAWEYQIANRWLLAVDRLSGQDGYTGVGLYWRFNRCMEVSVAVGFPHRGGERQSFHPNTVVDALEQKSVFSWGEESCMPSRLRLALIVLGAFRLWAMLVYAFFTLPVRHFGRHPVV